MICWHRWPRWEQYEQEYSYLPPVPSEVWQTLKGDLTSLKLQKKRIRERRRCEKCGMYQDRVAAELLG